MWCLCKQGPGPHQQASSVLLALAMEAPNTWNEKIVHNKHFQRHVLKKSKDDEDEFKGHQWYMVFSNTACYPDLISIANTGTIHNITSFKDWTILNSDTHSQYVPTPNS